MDKSEAFIDSVENADDIPAAGPERQREIFNPTPMSKAAPQVDVVLVAKPNVSDNDVCCVHFMIIENISFTAR